MKNTSTRILPSVQRFLGFARAKPLLATLLTLGLLHEVQAATDVSGIIAGETWTSTGSPYRLVGDAFVTALTIESNVVVQAAGNYEFEIGGQLHVKGGSDAPVRFTAENPTVGWKGILFRDAVPGSFFNYAIIEGAKQSAVRITNTPPAFTNCVIQNNTSPGHGGGILAQVSGNPLILKDCVISNNVAGPPGAGSIYGGGVCVFGPSVLTGCLIVTNRTQGSQGYGGGLFARGDCTMRGSQVINNIPGGASRHYADGIYFDTGALDMANCVVSSNGVTGAAGYGGGLWVAGGTAKVRNCFFMNNSHEGVRQETRDSAALINCTVTGNALLGVNGSGGTTVTNCIVYFNNGNGQQIGGTLSVAYSDVQGGVQPGPGNISFSPAFCPQNQSLIQGSPCIDMGSPAPEFNDTCIDSTLCTPYSRGTVRNDMGAYGGPLACHWLAGDAPAIATEPRSQSSCLGGTVTFSVGASGAEPLGYQWFYQNNALPNATTAQLTLTNLQSSNAGAYVVNVSNLFGTVSSVPAQLVVYDACIDLHMYAGLTISGQQGSRYVVSYSTDLGNPDGWVPVATNVLSSSDWFWLDMDSPFSPLRYYKANLKP